MLRIVLSSVALNMLSLIYVSDDGMTNSYLEVGLMQSTVSRIDCILDILQQMRLLLLCFDFLFLIQIVNCIQLLKSRFKK